MVSRRSVRNSAALATYYYVMTSSRIGSRDAIPRFAFRIAVPAASVSKSEI